jgi:hypothetical protein
MGALHEVPLQFPEMIKRPASIMGRAFIFDTRRVVQVKIVFAKDR